MKQGISSLNPYAASYVPVFKRQEENKTTEIIAGHTESANVNAWSGPASDNHIRGEASLAFDIHGIEELLNSEDAPQKDQSVYGSHDSCSQNPSGVTDKQRLHEDPEMELAYLGVLFPRMSDESVADVYSVNKGDLEASVDMLDQLEVYPELPDSLDIEDVSEFECPTEGMSMIPNQTTPGEANPSSSCSLKAS